MPKKKGKLVVNGNQQESEGIVTEAKNITINDGTIIVTSNDDGIKCRRRWSNNYNQWRNSLY